MWSELSEALEVKCASSVVVRLWYHASASALKSRQPCCCCGLAVEVSAWRRGKVTATEHTARTLYNMHHSWAASGLSCLSAALSSDGGPKKVPVGFLWRRFDAEFSALGEFLKVLAPGTWEINNIYSKDARFKLHIVHILHKYLHEGSFFTPQVVVLYLMIFSDPTEGIEISKNSIHLTIYLSIWAEDTRTLSNLPSRVDCSSFIRPAATKWMIFPTKLRTSSWKAVFLFQYRGRLRCWRGSEAGVTVSTNWW